MEKRIIIIGAGPAGTSCALHLHRLGFSNVKLFDKEEFPREKLCAGGLTKKAITEIELLNVKDKIEMTPMGGMVVKVGDKEVFKLEANNECYTVTRLELDNKLMSECKSKGIEVREKDLVHKVNMDNRTVTSDSGVYQFDILVIASGAKSKFRNLLGEPAIKVHATIMRTTAVKDGPMEMRFDYGTPRYIGRNLKSPSGYMFGATWVYPVDYNTMRGDFDYVYPNKEYDKEWVAVVPCNHEQPEQTKKENVYFIGDAGGYTNPMTAEGISAALYSGRAIADIIAGNGDRLDKTIRRHNQFFKRLSDAFWFEKNEEYLGRITAHPNVAKAAFLESMLLSDFNLASKFQLGVRVAARRYFRRKYGML